MATTFIDPFTFAGFSQPTTTPVPDELFDELAPRLTEAELRVLLYIVRRTYGFKRTSDRISLAQMANGIKAKDGRVVDVGTGMSRRGVMKGCAGLVAKGIVVVEKHQAQQGDSDVNVYRLRFRSEQGSGVGNQVPHGRERRSPGVGNKGAPQQTGIQETAKQQHAVVAELTAAGITATTAMRLSKSFPSDLIRAKLDLVAWLVESKSRDVARNPAGYLRRAIEEGYEPPPSYMPRVEREKAAAAKVALVTQVRKVSQSEAAQNAASAARLHAAVAAACPPQPIAGGRLTTATAWQQVLQALKGQVSGARFSTLFADTLLASCSARRAVVAAPSAIIIALMQKHVAQPLTEALSHIVGHRIVVEYQTFAEILRKGAGPNG